MPSNAQLQANIEDLKALIKSSVDEIKAANDETKAELTDKINELSGKFDVIDGKLGVIQIVRSLKFPDFVPPSPPMFVIVRFGYTPSPCERSFPPVHAFL